MANVEHVRIMKQGVQAWNAWRQENSSTRPDLSGADLSWAELNGANLSGADLRQANLWVANLRGADLCQADLSVVNLYGAKYNNKTQWPAGFRLPPEAIKVTQ
jgi:uncharacterized protein YjbI with pentapeptide repeats